jgi:Kdo2-lipid IVA lauroyltransferase/acyltransferase
MLKRLRYWLEWFSVKIFAGITPLLPLVVVRGLARLAGAAVYRLDRKSRAVALANLEAAFADGLDQITRERIACQSLQVFGRAFLELFWTPRLNKRNIRDYISFEDITRFNELIARPSIMVTCHFGNFEWASILFGLEGYTGMILTQRFKNDRLTPIFRKVRELSGNTAITQENSILRLFKGLRKGHPVGLLTDLTLKMEDPAVVIDAFGRKMRVTLAHCILHERTGIPIVPFIALPRSDGSYSVRIMPSLSFLPGTSHQQIAQACWNQFEPLIRQHPEQWMWVYKHWRYRPSTTDREYPFYANRSARFDEELRN